MGAIFGYYGFEDSILIKNMSNLEKHRAPDGFKYYKDKNLTLGQGILKVGEEFCTSPISNENEDLGTDFYDSELKKVKTLPYRDNYGYFFSSGPNTWHGMEKKEIIKERRCLQVNYVTFKTDWKVED